MENNNNHDVNVDLQLVELDYKQVAAVADIKRICQELLTGGEIRGDEWWALNIKRQDKSIGSFSVNLNTGAAKDFSTGDYTSDIIGTVAYLSNCSQYDAKKWIINNQFVGKNPRPAIVKNTEPDKQTILNAQKIFDLAQPVEYHAYLERKQIETTPFIKHIDVKQIADITGWYPKNKNEKLQGDCLIAPIFIDDTLTSLEIIDSFGKKAALPGKGTKKNGYWTPYRLPTKDGQETLNICEGVATTMTVLMADYGNLAVAALSLDNIKNIVSYFRKKYPLRPIRICADLIKGTDNVESKILALADLPNVTVVKPNELFNDFNDMHVAQGLDAVRTALAQPLTVDGLFQSVVLTEDNAFDVDIDDLENAELIPTEFVIEPFFPRRHTTLLGGHGGSGKSLLAITMACHVACGIDWHDLTVHQGKVLFVSLEDDGDLLRFRLKRTAIEYSLPYKSIADNLRLIDGSEWEPLAIESNVNGVKSIVMTNNAKRVERMCVGRDLVIIDNASDAFEGNENERRQVRRFVKALTAMVKPHNGAMVLLAHVDKLAARGGSAGNTYSGSTAWHNSSRSRLALIKNDDGTLTLIHEKLNVGKELKDNIQLQWSANGVPIPMTYTMKEDKEMLSSSLDDDAVMTAFQEAEKNGESIPTAMQGAITTYTVLMAYPSCQSAFSGKDGKIRLRNALVRLSTEQRIKRSMETNANRKTRERWRLVIETPAVVTPIKAAAGQKRPWEG